MAFMMLTNTPPFNGKTKREIYRTAEFDEPNYALLKKYAKPEGELVIDFIKKCLTKNFELRPTMMDLASHPWLE